MLERWLLVSSVGISPLNQAIRPWPTPSCRSVAAAEASTAMPMIVVLLCPSGISNHSIAKRPLDESVIERPADRVRHSRRDAARLRAYGVAGSRCTGFRIILLDNSAASLSR